MRSASTSCLAYTFADIKFESQSVYQGSSLIQEIGVLKGGRHSALQSEAVAGGDGPIGG